MKNKPKHTPGPWENRIGQETKNSPFCDGRIEIATESNTLICAVEDETGADWTGKEMKANAQLIAAAPDLLEAAKKALDLIESLDAMMEEGDGDELVEVTALKSAIAKAEGKS